MKSFTFVATHSSQVLRGVIQTASELQIIRLTRGKRGFAAKRVDSNVLSEAMRKPSVRAETVLDGVFSQAVAVVEGDGDPVVYQSVWESVGERLNFDIHFTTVGGTGGIAETCHLYRVLGIPVAVVADLDVVTDLEKVKRILASLRGESAHTESLLKRVADVVESLRLLPPTVTADKARQSLERLSKTRMDWSRGDDAELRNKLYELGNAVNRMRRIKGGSSPEFAVNTLGG